MTKSGAPSPIGDIRLFDGWNRLVYFKDDHAATAFARRVAFLLNARGLSFGSWTHLYICVGTGDESVGRPLGYEWWFRPVTALVAPEFKAASEVRRNEILIDCIRQTLHRVLPAHPAEIDAACDEAIAKGPAIRFLIKRKVTRSRQIDVSANIATGADPSQLYVTVTDLVSGVVHDAPPIDLMFYGQASLLVGSIKIDDEAIIITPKTSVTAQLAARNYTAPFRFPFGALQPLAQPPHITGPL